MFLAFSHPVHPVYPVKYLLFGKADTRRRSHRELGIYVRTQGAHSPALFALEITLPVSGFRALALLLLSIGFAQHGHAQTEPDLRPKNSRSVDYGKGWLPLPG